MTPPPKKKKKNLKRFNQFLEKFREIAFFGNHEYRFGDSNVNSVGGDDGKLLLGGRPAGQTDGRTDGER